MAIELSVEGKIALARAEEKLRRAVALLTASCGADVCADAMRQISDALHGGARLDWGDRRLVMEGSARFIEAASITEEQRRLYSASTADAPF